MIENDVVGGTQVLFEALVSELNRRGELDATVVNTARPLAGRSRLGKARLDMTALLAALARLWRHAPAADLIVWCASSRAVLLGGPLVWFLCRLRRRPLCIRLFGGGFDAALDSAPPVLGLAARRTFLRAELLLVETRRAAARLESSCRTRWIPNTRNMPPRRRAYRPSCRRLLFLSVLERDKGLPELVAAARTFPHGVRLSVFGPAVRSFDVGAIRSLSNATYRGVAPPDRVPDIMEAHDALVLPTRYRHEGYPGVVIEAFQMGLPVIVSRMPSLQELVTEGRDGLFVEAGSVESLRDAVIRLCSDDGLFRRLRAGALDTGEQYRSDGAADLIENLCRRAASGRSPF